MPGPAVGTICNTCMPGSTSAGGAAGTATGAAAGAGCGAAIAAAATSIASAASANSSSESLLSMLEARGCSAVASSASAASSSSTSDGCVQLVALLLLPLCSLPARLCVRVGGGRQQQQRTGTGYVCLMPPCITTAGSTGHAGTHNWVSLLSILVSRLVAVSAAMACTARAAAVAAAVVAAAATAEHTPCIHRPALTWPAVLPVPLFLLAPLPRGAGRAGTHPGGNRGWRCSRAQNCLILHVLSPNGHAA